MRARGLIKEHGWVPEPRLGPARPGHRARPRTRARQPATGWWKGSGSSTKHFQMAVGTEAAGAFQSLGEARSLALALSPQTFRPAPLPPPQPHSTSRPACQGSFRRPGGEGGRMPMWVSAGPLLARAARGERRILQIRKLLFGSLRM